MSDYLTNLIRRSFGPTEGVYPRPIGLFETPSSTDKFVPKYFSNQETMAEGEEDSEETSDSPSAVLPLSEPEGASGQIAADARGDSESRQHQMGDLSANSNWPPRQPADRPLPLSGPIVFQSPEGKTKQLSSHPDSKPSKSELPTHRLPLIEGISGERPSQLATDSTVLEPSRIVIPKAPQESGPEQRLPPPMITRNRADTKSLQGSSAQQGEAKLEKATSPDLNERSDRLNVSPLPTIPIPEPRPTFLATIEPDLARIHVGTYTQLMNKASSEPVINVTIGRIEVRATQSREPESPKSQGKPSGVMSLEQYLNMRSRGGSR